MVEPRAGKIYQHRRGHAQLNAYQRRTAYPALRLSLACLAAAALCAASSCRERGEQPRGAAARPVGSTQRPDTADQAGLWHRSRHMMGTLFSIAVAGASRRNAHSAVDAAFDEMARLETALSEWRKDSEISRINAAAGTEPVRLSDDSWAVIKAGMEVSKWSRGAFDMSWAVMRDLWRFEPGRHRIATPEEIAKRRHLMRFQDIVLDEAAHTVMLRQPGMRIGLGGIAKGYALDRAADILLRHGIANFMLYGGGQVRVHGKRGERPWRVGIRHPRRMDYFGFLEVSSGSISTSGDYERAFFARGRRWHHILDPRSGLPAEHTASVTVIAQKGVYADALSTALFVLGPDAALRRLPTAPGTPQAIIVDTDLKLHVSTAIKERLQMRVPLRDGRLPPAQKSR